MTIWRGKGKGIEMGQDDLRNLFIAGYLMMIVLLVWGINLPTDAKAGIYMPLAGCLAGYFIGLGLSKRNIG